MAVLSGALTMADWAKRYGSNEKIRYIVEILSQQNEILDDMLMVEGNEPTGHKTVIRTGIPSGTWRLLNQGIPTSKTTTAPITFGAGNLEAESAVDVDVVALNGDGPRFRLSEVQGFLQGLSQQMASTIIYGNQQTNPERFTGLAPYYNTVSTATSATAVNVIDAGGTGSDNTSIWIVTWGERTIKAFFPRGQAEFAGLVHQDMGKWRVPDSDVATNHYYAWVDHYKWNMGLAVEDWRYAARVCNIDVSDLNTANAANLVNYLIDAVYQLPTTNGVINPVTGSDADGISGPMGRTAIYANRTVRKFLDKQALEKNNAYLSLMEASNGEVITAFRGIPIRTVDAILNTEARIT